MSFYLPISVIFILSIPLESASVSYFVLLVKTDKFHSYHSRFFFFFSVFSKDDLLHSLNDCVAKSMYI